MAKPKNRPYSGYNLEALALLGHTIRAARIDRKVTEEEMAARMGVSRSLVQRIEKGNPGSAIGAVFEAATIVGVPLFEAEQERLAAHRTAAQERLSLLPKRVRTPKRMIKDDF